MNTKLLVSVAEVKALCPMINNGIDNTLVSNAILLIEDTLLKDSLTLDMWEDILTNSGTTTNKYLIDNYIKNLVSYGVWQYLTVTMTYQLNSSGLRIKTSDHSAAAEAADISFVRSYIQNFIDNTRRLMQEYIEDHPNDYPKYYIYEDGKKPHTNNFRIGRVGGGLPTDYDDCCQYWKGI